MKRLTLMTSIAGLAMIAGPALADPPAGRGGGNAGATMGAGTNGGMNGGMSATGQTMRDQARINSQGPANASATGIAHANENSVLSGTTTDTTVRGQGAANASVNGLAHAGTGSALGGAGSMELNTVTGGTDVIGTGGTSIGTVTGLMKNRSGAVVGIQVELEGGASATIPASSLTLSGGVLTTTWTGE